MGEGYFALFYMSYILVWVCFFASHWHCI